MQIGDMIGLSFLLKIIVRNFTCQLNHDVEFIEQLVIIAHITYGLEAYIAIGT